MKQFFLTLWRITKVLLKIAVAILALLLVIGLWQTCSEDDKPTVYTVEQVPNLRLTDAGNHVSDPDTILTASDKAEINSTLQELKSAMGADVAVVVLPAITPDMTNRQFSTALFEAWGIGDAKRDDGLLILFNLDPENNGVVFETGYGMEALLPDAICKRIQMKHIVPYMKEGNYSEGILSGAKAVSEYLLKSEERLAKRQAEDSERQAKEAERKERKRKEAEAFAALHPAEQAMIKAKAAAEEAAEEAAKAKSNFYWSFAILPFTLLLFYVLHQTITEVRNYYKSKRKKKGEKALTLLVLCTLLSASAMAQTRTEAEIADFEAQTEAYEAQRAESLQQTELYDTLILIQTGLFCLPLVLLFLLIAIAPDKAIKTSGGSGRSGGSWGGGSSSSGGGGSWGGGSSGGGGSESSW